MMNKRAFAIFLCVLLVFSNFISAAMGTGTPCPTCGEGVLTYTPSADALEHTVSCSTLSCADKTEACAYTIAATCTQNARCVCGRKVPDTALGHDYDYQPQPLPDNETQHGYPCEICGEFLEIEDCSFHYGNESGCTATFKTCEYCDRVVYIPNAEHDYDYDTYVPLDGVEQHAHPCRNCDAYESVSACEYDGDDWYSCTATSKTCFYCEREVTFEALGHVFDRDAFDPVDYGDEYSHAHPCIYCDAHGDAQDCEFEALGVTCTATEKVCIICERTEQLFPPGHDYDDYEYVQTADDDGTAQHGNPCMECGTLGNIVTCVEFVYDGHTCTATVKICVLCDNEVACEPPGHNWIWEYDEECDPRFPQHKSDTCSGAAGIDDAVCDENGLETVTAPCKVFPAACTGPASCPDCYREFDKAIGHNFGNWTYDAQTDSHSRACQREGCEHVDTEACEYSDYTCTALQKCWICDGVKPDSYAPHEYGNWEYTGNGDTHTHTRYCDSASEDCTQTEACDIVPATCIAAAYCSVCEQVIGSALGHNIVVDPAVAPTCLATGLTAGEHCSRCDEATVAQNTLSALGHDIVVDAAVPATCLATGLTAGEHCSRCNDATVARNTLNALGHDIVVDPAVAPTCLATGLTAGEHCSRCDGATVAQNTINALGHDIVVDPAVAPTCLATGLTEGEHCWRCHGATVAQAVIEALGHAFAGDTCAACGFYQPKEAFIQTVTLVVLNAEQQTEAYDALLDTQAEETQGEATDISILTVIAHPDAGEEYTTHYLHVPVEVLGLLRQRGIDYIHFKLGDAVLSISLAALGHSQDEAALLSLAGATYVFSIVVEQTADEAGYQYTHTVSLWSGDEHLDITMRLEDVKLL